MTAGEIVAIAVAGLAAGTINTVVGSGTLITFPVLLAFGYAPVTANVSNTIGLVPGIGLGRDRLPPRARGPARAGAAPRDDVGARRDHGGGAAAGAARVGVQGDRAGVHRAGARADGGCSRGSTRWLVKREIDLDGHEGGGDSRCSRSTSTGVYGGYFGAAQGIMLLAILGVALSQDLHRTNALKNVLAGLVNGVAGLYFVFAAHVEWAPAAIIACTSIVGAQLGARYGRRLPPEALRAVIVVVGVFAIVRLVVD